MSPEDQFIMTRIPNSTLNMFMICVLALFFNKFIKKNNCKNLFLKFINASSSIIFCYILPNYYFLINRDMTNQTENFPLVYPKTSSGTVKCASLKVTVPKPFQFHTDNRLKNKPTEKYEKKDFVSELRQNTVLQPHVSMKLHVNLFIIFFFGTMILDTVYGLLTVLHQ